MGKKHAGEGSGTCTPGSAGLTGRAGRPELSFPGQGSSWAPQGRNTHWAEGQLVGSGAGKIKLGVGETLPKEKGAEALKSPGENVLGGKMAANNASRSLSILSTVLCIE